MSCEQLQDLLTAYLDDECTPEERRLVEEHVEQCPDCREMLALFEAIPTVLAEEESVEAPRSIRRGVMAEIRAEKRSVPKHRWNLRRVAAALVLFCLSFATGLLPLMDMYAAQNDMMLMEAADLQEDGAFTPEAYTATGEGDTVLKLVPDESARGPLDPAPDPDGSTENAAPPEELLLGRPELEEPAWYEGLPWEPLLFAVTGIFFAALLLWTARPLKN